VILIILIILRSIEPVRPGLDLRQQLAQLDLLGQFFLMPSTVCLLLLLQWGGSPYAWSDGRIIALFVVFGAALLAFILVQVLNPHTATIPARVVDDRSIISGIFLLFCLAGAMMIFIYFVPPLVPSRQRQDCYTIRHRYAANGPIALPRLTIQAIRVLYTLRYS
jgi:hypothetical protein